MTTEKRLHKSICQYIKLQYPNIYFMSDPSGLRMSIGMATELKATRSKHAQLDIVVFEPKGKFHGLFLEVKKDRSEVFKKNGEFKQNKHVKEQAETIEHLKSKGYDVHYVFDFDEGIQIIETYLALDIEVNE